MEVTASSLCWFAVPEGPDSFWPHLLLPHGDVLQRACEREVPVGGLHGGAKWQLQVRGCREGLQNGMALSPLGRDAGGRGRSNYDN